MRLLLTGSCVLSGCGGPPVKKSSMASMSLRGEDTGDTGAEEVPGLTGSPLYTNDWQSHMFGQGSKLEYTPNTTGDDTTGGLARAKTLPMRFAVYDAGDWVAGALFQLLATSHAAELQMMQNLTTTRFVSVTRVDWRPQSWVR